MADVNRTLATLTFRLMGGICRKRVTRNVFNPTALLDLHVLRAGDGGKVRRKRDITGTRTILS